MPRALKVVLLLLLLGFILFMALCGVGFQLIRRTLPQTEGTVYVTGLSQPVDIYRDGYHIPHILAQSDEAAYFAQGFATAQDRLWQMDLWRRAGWGRLSQVFGRSTLSQDSLAVIIGFGRTVRALEQQITPETRRQLTAYANGVNAFLDSNRGKLPIEFMILGYKPAPWTVADCLMMTRILAWNLNQGWPTDAVLTEIFRQLGPAALAELMPQIDIASYTDNGINRTALPAFNLDALAGQAAVGGSNGWAISGARSTTGRPLLAGDPHTAHMLPGLWHEVHLSGDGLDVTGLALPGLPGILMGHNAAIAWTATHLPADDADLIWLTPNTPLQTVQETIYLPRDSVIHVTVQISPQGPVVNDLLHIDRPLLALRWSGHDLADDVAALRTVNQAGDWKTFRSALSIFRLAPFHFLYADTSGHIGMQAAGAIYARAGLGVLPRQRGWGAPLPFHQLPSQFDPPVGALWAANTGLPAGVPGLEAVGSRMQRLSETLGGEDTLNLNDVKRLQGDVISPWARDLVRDVAQKIDTKRLEDSDIAQTVRDWQDWDGGMQAGSREAAVFQVFLKQLGQKTLEPIMGKTLYFHYWKQAHLVRQALAAMIRSDHSFFIEGQHRNRAAVLHAALDATGEWLRKNAGESDQWRLGNLLTLTLTHPMGTHPLLAASFNLGPVAMGGAPTTLNVSGFTDFEVTWGPTARMVIDLAQRDNSVTVLPAGESGHVLHEHYRNQLPLYRDRLYHPSLSDTSRIRRSGWHKLTLKTEMGHE